MNQQAPEAVMEYDAQGDLVIHIPQQLLTRGVNRIVFKIEQALPETPVAPDWDSDPVLDLVGRFTADTSDGSLRHDRDLPCY